MYGIRGVASNMQSGSNPPFSVGDFYKLHPQFEGKVDADIVQLYVDFANSCVQEFRFGTAWKIAMGFFIAHFLTIYLMGSATAESTEGQVLAKAQAKGLVTSKSAGDVSIGYDFSSISQDLDGWAQWKLTHFGIQYASLAKLMGKGMIYVW